MVGKRILQPGTCLSGSDGRLFPQLGNRMLLNDSGTRFGMRVGITVLRDTGFRLPCGSFQPSLSDEFLPARFHSRGLLCVRRSAFFFDAPPFLNRRGVPARGRLFCAFRFAGGGGVSGFDSVRFSGFLRCSFRRSVGCLFGCCSMALLCRGIPIGGRPGVLILFCRKSLRFGVVTPPCRLLHWFHRRFRCGWGGQFQWGGRFREDRRFCRGSYSLRGSRRKFRKNRVFRRGHCRWHRLFRRRCRQVKGKVVQRRFHRFPPCGHEFRHAGPNERFRAA